MSSFFRCLPHRRALSGLLSPLLAWVCNLYATLLCAALCIFFSWQLLFRKAHTVRAHTTYSLLHSMDELISMLLDVIAYMMLYEACRNGLAFVWIDSLINKMLKCVSRCMYNHSQPYTSPTTVTLPLTHTLHDVDDLTECELLSGNAYWISNRPQNRVCISKANFTEKFDKMEKCNHLHVNNCKKNDKCVNYYEPLCGNNNNVCGEETELHDMHSGEENNIISAKNDCWPLKNGNRGVSINTATFTDTNKATPSCSCSDAAVTTSRCNNDKAENDNYKQNKMSNAEQLLTEAHVHMSKVPECREISIDLHNRTELSVFQFNAVMNALTSNRSAHNSQAEINRASTSTSSTSPSSFSPVSSQNLPSSQLLLMARSTWNTPSSAIHHTSTLRKWFNLSRCVLCSKCAEIPFANEMAKMGERLVKKVSLLIKPTSQHQRKEREWQTIIRTESVVVVVVLIISMHALPRLLIAASNNVSRTLMMLIIRCIVDSLFYFVCLCLIQCKIIRTVQQHCANKFGNKAKYRRFILPVIIILSLLVLIYAIGRLAWYVHSIQTIPELERSILGDPINPCAAEGRTMNTSLRASWVWPALLPRRTFNFYTGSESCHDSKWHTLGFIDDSEMHVDNPLLVIPATCADHSMPHVYVERPSRSEFNKADKINSDDTVWGAKQYHAELEALFGSEEMAQAKKLIVHRTKKSKLITEVEVDLFKYQAYERKPISIKEKEIRRYWPTSKVFEIPLGHSAAYSLSCSEGQHEEVFMFPPILSMAMEPSKQSLPHLPSFDEKINSTIHNNSTNQKPAGNLLILLFDALSRQAAARSLPHFSAWMQKFRARQEKLSENKENTMKEGYVVLEPLAHTTLGHSTAGNLVPYLAGITDGAAKITERDKEQKWNVMNRSLFTISKQTHGDVISTAFSTGFCHDFFEVLMGNKIPSSGRGTSIRGIDYYMYEPMCDLEYTLSHGNFNGPYSIVKRCIANKHVHEHLFEYTTHLLRRQMIWQNTTRNDTFHDISTNMSNDKPEEHQEHLSQVPQSHTQSISTNREFFFDISYFIEAHEGTQGVIGQVDDDLVAFMEYIDNELHYFDNPLNSFIFLSDHGNHMGPYYEFSVAGMFERTTPASLYVIHPEVFRRIDANKHQDTGTSERNFRNRLTRLHSAVDIYYTLADLLNINVTAYEAYHKVKLPPSSLFDAIHTKYINSCSDFKTREEMRPCSLDFCSKMLERHFEKVEPTTPY